MRNITFGLSVVLALLALASASGASTGTVLFNFCPDPPTCAGGANPQGDLVEDTDHNLWGTAKNGGAGFGTIFELTVSSGYTALGQVYKFQGGSSDGAFPEAGLVYNKANNALYGTTSAGGNGSCNGGCGTVFVFHPGGSTDTILHSFGSFNGDGLFPRAKLLLGALHNLHGTTSAGGSGNCNGGCGTVFVVNPAKNTYNVIHSFSVGEGQNLVSGLVFDSQNNLWGTAEDGGANGFGTIFELAAPSYGTVTYTHSFEGAPLGANPAAALTFDPTIGGTLGTLYGTTSAGGDGGCTGGCGTVFQLEISGLAYNNFYSFTGANGGTGTAPIAHMALETKHNAQLGNLYGTASLGGSCSFSQEGCGTVFEICPPTRCSQVAEYTLFEFDGTHGQNPAAGLLLNFGKLEGPLEEAKFPPPTGTRGACTTNCIGTAESGGQNGAGTANGITK